LDAPQSRSTPTRSVEWIVERTALNNVLQHLPNYGSVTFEQSFAFTNLAGSEGIRYPSVGQAVDMVDIWYGNVPHYMSEASVERPGQLFLR
jgi:hypothetical protein